MKMLLQTPVILDVDTGVDDALGIILALNSPELDLRAITVCGGNNGLEQCCLNTVRVTHFALKELCPAVAAPVVARGLNPGGKEPEGAAVHGGDGLGGISHRLAFEGEDDLIVPQAAPVVRAVLDHAEAAGEKITIVTTGPLTNFASWTLDMPDLLLNTVSEVICMGGAFRAGGNITPAAEFNIYEDPSAAAVALAFCRGDERSGPAIPITFAGLDVTHKVVLRRAVIENLAARHPHAAMPAFVRDLTTTYMDFYERVRGLEGCALHDPLAVALAIDKSFCAIEPLHVEIETRGEHTRGMTVADTRDSLPAKQNPKRTTGVCTAVDADRFEKFFLQRVTGIEAD
jgi:purine nucleosidase/pyrimidine-specific ribonucleoside hydrolase